MCQQSLLDLAGLDAEAANLQLAVGTTQEFEIPERLEPHQVAGTVHARRRLRKRVGYEALRRQPGVFQIAPGQTVTRGAQLARNPNRHQMAIPIHHVHLRSGDRRTNRYRISNRVARSHGVVGRERSVFRWPVAVDNPALREPAQMTADVRAGASSPVRSCLTPASICGRLSTIW